MMMSAIYLENKSTLMAVEVHDVGTERLLSPELVAELTISQVPPKEVFGFRRSMAERAG